MTGVGSFKHTNGSISSGAMLLGTGGGGGGGGGKEFPFNYSTGRGKRESEESRECKKIKGEVEDEVEWRRESHWWLMGGE
jgi:hypothetical protein